MSKVAFFVDGNYLFNQLRYFKSLALDHYLFCVKVLISKHIVKGICNLLNKYTEFFIMMLLRWRK